MAKGGSMVEYTVCRLTKGQLIGSFPRKKMITTVFVAYSFHNDDSNRFRSQVEQAIKTTVSLRHIEVTDGHVAVGAKWADEIRKRLQSSRLVIAELSQLNPEVFFESGFAFGLNKPILPVTNYNNLKLMPRFLTEIQFGFNSSVDDVKSVVNAISEHLSITKKNNKSLSSQYSSPNDVLVIAQEKNSDIANKISYFCAQNNLDFNRYDSESPISHASQSLASSVNRSSLIVACFNYNEGDYVINFVAGMVCANPKAGIGKKKLDRQVVLIIPNNESPSDFVSDTARRMGGVLKIINESDLKSTLTGFANSRKKWEDNQKI